ncbi:hypothetical protein LZC95_13295 [Pendulispora brunnea]|uniref:Lipoprotein n=1 Tax=Pendulispora brunnea TaxID=2905690 RepID=A0ABZ2KL59_9BACT
MSPSRALALFALLAPFALTQCTVHTTPEPAYTTVYGAEVYSQPYVVYEGRPHYYVHDHWVYSTPRGWMTYRNPPPALERQRPYVQQAPPAYRQPVAPPAYRQPAYPAGRPPRAVRVP